MNNPDNKVNILKEYNNVINHPKNKKGAKGICILRIVVYGIPFINLYIINTIPKNDPR